MVDGHSISGTAVLPRNDSYPAAKLPYTRTEQMCAVRGNFVFSTAKNHEFAKHRATNVKAGYIL